MAGTYVDNWSNKYATNQWVWWTERDAVGIAKFNPTLKDLLLQGQVKMERR